MSKFDIASKADDIALNFDHRIETDLSIEEASNIFNRIVGKDTVEFSREGLGAWIGLSIPAGEFKIGSSICRSA